MSTSENSYKRTIVQQNEHFEIVTCEWSSLSISPMHDHAWSQCFILIESGRFENTLDLGFGQQSRVLEAGQVIATPLGAHHEIRCLSASGKTLHVYVPRIAENEMEPRFRELNQSRMREELDLNLSPRGQDWEQLSKALKQIESHSVSTQSPLFMNQLFSGVFAETLAAEALVTRSKATMATHEASPAFSAIEVEVVERLGELIGWGSRERDGISVPGGSAANFMALHCARQKKFPRMKEQGLDGRVLQVFVSADSHYSFIKACAALGIGTQNLISVPVDAHGRMDCRELDRLIGDCLKSGGTPLAVCATAGTTVRGAFDPIEDIAKLCSRHQVWLHVDGAWGGPALFSAKARALLAGVAKADSMTFDGHKLLGAGLTCSFFLTRHAGLLLEANDVSGGEYIFHDGDTLNRGRLSWQCGRRADALSLWTLWKSHGTEGLGLFVDRMLQLRDCLVHWIQDQPRIEPVSAPEFLNVCLRIRSPQPQVSDADWTLQVREKLKERNLAFINYSSDSNGPFLRLILANPRLEFTTLTNILRQALAIGS